MKGISNTRWLSLYLEFICVVACVCNVSGHTPNIPSGVHSYNYHGNTFDIGDPRFHLDRSSLIDFVIHRGCMYMSGFVRSHYVKDTKNDDRRFVLPQVLNSRKQQPHQSNQGIPQSNTQNNTGDTGIIDQSGLPFPGIPFSDLQQSQQSFPRTDHGPPPDQSNHLNICEWQQFIGHMCDTFHVPKEFKDALMDCGMRYSMNSFIPLPATENMMHTCNMSNSDVASTSSFIGKRNQITKEHLEKEKSKLVESRDVIDEDRGDIADNNHDENGLYDSTVNIDDVENSTSLKTWCQGFSMKVRNSYHYSHKHALKPSWYWMLDVYRNINKYRMPKYYAHSLIGCGLLHAMYALHLPLTQTIIYLIHGL